MSGMVHLKMAKGYSHAKQYSIIYEWEVDKISTSIELSNSSNDPYEFKSPKFSTGSSFEDFWYLLLRINRSSESVMEEFLRMTVRLSSDLDNKKNIRAMYSIFILNNKKEKCTTSFEVVSNPYSERVFGYLIPAEEWDQWDGFCLGLYSIDVSELFKKKDEFLPDDTLTFCVDLTVYDNCILSSFPAISFETSKHQLTDHLKDLFVTKRRSDVVISVKDEKFQAHKLILAARSPVFDAMFSHDMREKKENEIEIPDVDPQIFKKLLEFIYTDKVGNLDDYAEELLEVANKYQLQSLKEMCAVSLSKTINVENAIPIMLFADRNNVKQLVEYAEKFIIINLMKIQNTKDYEALEKSYPSLFFAILKKYAAGNKI